MNVSLHSQRAIITGASSGIGQATALAFSQAGCSVALLGRSEDKVQGVVDQIRQAGGEAQGYCLDLSQLDTVAPQMTAIAEAFGPVDILVNNAGMGYTNSLQQTPLADWKMVLDLNLTSVFQVTMAVLATMRPQKHGIVINVGSIAAHHAFAGWGAYCISKSALAMFSQVLALEERHHGIRVTTVFPGSTNTPIWDTATVQADFDRSQMLTPEIVAQAILQTVLLPSSAVIESLTLMPSAGTF
jgi:NADP-dependent 3-hydroxy acid dehydrogenase YdfG